MRRLLPLALLGCTCVSALAGTAAAQPRAATPAPAPSARGGGANGAVAVVNGTLTVTNGARLGTPYDLTVAPGATLAAAEGGLAFTGAADQAFTTPAAPQVVRDVVVAKAGGAAVVLGMDLDVTGVLTAGGGTVSLNGHVGRLPATLDVGGQIERLAAVAGDGSTLNASFVYERPHVDGEGWRMIAAPFAAVPYSTLTDDFHTQGATGADTPLGDPNLLRWVPANAPGSRYVGVTDYAQPFDLGRGYFLYAYGTDPGTGTPILPTTWDVEGEETDAAVEVPLSYSVEDAEARWNLLGNPYAAPIDWHAAQAAGSFQAAYAVWDPAANAGLGNYAYYSSAGVATGRAGRYIPAFQGFWAEASGTSPFLFTYDRAWKAPAEAPVYVGRAGEGAVAHLRLRLAGEGLEATAPAALFLEGGAAGPDSYDAAWLRPLSQDYAAAYFLRDDPAGLARLVFDARPAAHGEPLRLAVEVTRAGTYTLSWPGLEAAPVGALMLTDLATGASVDMRAASGYTFTAVANAAPVTPGGPPSLAGGATTARFEVAFGVTTAGAGTPEVPAALALTVGPNPLAGYGRVRYGVPTSGSVRVALYDVLGRHVATLADGERGAGWHEARLDASALAGGVYVVRLEADGEARTTRLTVAR